LSKKVKWSDCWAAILILDRSSFAEGLLTEAELLVGKPSRKLPIGMKLAENLTKSGGYACQRIFVAFGKVNNTQGGDHHTRGLEEVTNALYRITRDRGYELITADIERLKEQGVLGF
jgi:hypothetical protein